MNDSAKFSAENERECFERAQEYCDGYFFGYLSGRNESESEQDSADHASESYRAGFKRGVASGQNESRGSVSEWKAPNEISDEFRWLDQQNYPFTEEQRARWNILNNQIKARGQKSWQDILLGLYSRMKIYEGAIIGEDEENTALRLVRRGVVRRLAKSLL